MQETRVRSLGGEKPLEKEMATHSGTLAWKIPWTGEPCRLQSMGSQRVGHDWAISLLLGGHRRSRQSVSISMVSLPTWVSVRVQSPNMCRVLPFSEKAAVTAEGVCCLQWEGFQSGLFLAARPETSSLGLKTQYKEERLKTHPQGCSKDFTGYEPESGVNSKAVPHIS